MIIKLIKYLSGGRILLPIFIAGMLLIIRIKSIRRHPEELNSISHFLGYAPNLIAALTLPFLFLYFFIYYGNRKKIIPVNPAAVNSNRHLVYAGAIAMAGLLVWEFLQMYRPNRTFDVEDVIATVAGVFLFWIVMFTVKVITKKVKPNNL
jgi:glycopeptide antibiotics resistance protein